VNTAQAPYPLYPGIGCIHRLCGASSHADLGGSAASTVRRQRERVVLLAIGSATKMSAKSFAANSGPMTVRIHPSAGALVEVIEARRGSTCCGR
jgi:hypothetical protein